jgi:hypothetical protein
MPRFSLAVIAASALGSVSIVGCAASPLPAVRAAQVERVQCDQAASGEADVQRMERTDVLGAAPLYSHVMTGTNGSEERIDGAKVVVRPPVGLSSEDLTRALQCHSARAVLGEGDRSQLVDDPFWLPGSWVTIEVRPENGNYAVILEAEGLSANIRLAERAESYAKRHVRPAVL